MAIPLVAPLTPINLNDAGTMKTSQDHKAVVEATKDGPSSMSLTPNVNSDVQSQDPDIAGESSSKLNRVEFGDEADQYQVTLTPREKKKSMQKHRPSLRRNELKLHYFKPSKLPKFDSHCGCG